MLFSLLPKIRCQLDETSIDKHALRELVLMLDYVVSEIKERILCLTPQTCSNEDDEIKRKSQPRLNETISRIKQVLELKRPYEEADDGKIREEKEILEERLMEGEERIEAIAERIRELEKEEQAAYDDWEREKRRREEEATMVFNIGFMIG